MESGSSDQEQTPFSFQQILSEMDLPREKLVANYLKLRLEHRPDLLNPILAKLEAGHDLETALSEFFREEARSAGDDQAERNPVAAAGEIPNAGDVYGSFVIEKQIARGGMGLVFLAQHKTQPNLKAALKIIRPGMETKTNLARFKREMELLASLDHPHIAKILDSGTTTSGSPWLAMQYVRGRAVDQYCNEENLSLRRRLVLFLKVVDAVSYAHRKLVLHRDLKPSNILVDEHGEPYLLDFGIAAILETEGGGHLTVDIAAGRVFTPDYSAPEQYQTERLTTAVDVFCLGLLLHVLVYGYLPKRHTLDGTVLEGEEKRTAELGSTTGEPSPTGRGKAVSRDLNAVIYKALATEPGDRYGSAGLLGEDLEAFLDGLPVKAKAKSNWYYARKFVKRHAWAVAFGMAVVLTIIASLIGFIIQNRIIRGQKQIAEQERQVASEVTAFLVDTFNLPDPVKGKGGEVTAVELLDYGHESLKERFPEPTLIKARLLHTQGRVFLNMGETEKAMPLLEQAIEIMAKLESDPYQLMRAKLDYITSVARLDSSRLITLIEAYLVEMDVYDFKDLEGEAYNMLGYAHNQEGDLEKGGQYIEKGLALRREALGARNEAVVPSLHNLSITRFREGRLQEAETLMREAVDIQKETNPRNPGIINNLTSLAMILDTAGHPQEAREIQQQALDRALEQMGPDHSQSFHAAVNLAYYDAVLGDNASAEALLDSLMDRDILDRNPAHPDTIRSMQIHASTYLKIDKPEGAEAVYRRVVNRCKNDPRVRPRDQALAMGDLARFYLDRERFNEALDHYTETLTYWEEQDLTEQADYGYDAYMAGKAASGAGRSDLSDTYYAKAITALNQHLDRYPKTLFEAYRHFGESLLARGRLQKAEQVYLEAWTLFQSLPREQKEKLPADRIQETIQGLAAVYRGLKIPERADFFEAEAARLGQAGSK